MRARPSSWSAGWRWPKGSSALPPMMSLAGAAIPPRTSSSVRRSTCWSRSGCRRRGRSVGRPRMPGPAPSSIGLPSSAKSTVSASKSRSLTGPCPRFIAARPGGDPVRSWCIATAWTAARNCSTGRASPRHSPGAAYPLCAWISREVVKPCACRIFRSFRTASIGHPRLSTGWKINPTAIRNELA